MTNEVIQSIADDIQSYIQENVSVGILTPRDSVNNDDMPTSRIGIAFYGTSRSIRSTNTDYIQVESLRIQILESGVVIKKDLVSNEVRINQVMDKIVDWCKSRMSSPSLVHEDLRKIQYQGKQSVSRGANYLEQFLEVKVLRQI